MILYGDEENTQIKASVFLAEKNIEFTFQDIRNFRAPERHIASFPFQNSGGWRKPVLVEGDNILLGASAICTYAEQKRPVPALISNIPEQQPLVQFLEEFYYTTLDPLTSNIDIHSRGEHYSNPELAKGLTQNRLIPILTFLEKLSLNTTYFLSEDISIADISLGAAIWPISKNVWSNNTNYDVSVFGDIRYQFPRISQLCDVLWQREAFQRLLK